jgi:hypothetical protein
MFYPGLTVLAATLLMTITPSLSAYDGYYGHRKALKLLDLSGLVWLRGDVFLAVSDAKNPDENDLNRLSLITLPDSLDGIGFYPLTPRYPGGPSNDLESAAGIPGTNRVLLVESADDDSSFQRIFLAKVKRHRVRIMDVLDWRSFTDVKNIEATAVADTGAGLIFIWAERNSGEQFTYVNWARLSLRPFAIGWTGVQSVEFTLPEVLVNGADDRYYTRSIVGMEVDSQGNIYTVAAFDPEGTVDNPDIGPFRSAVFKIGNVISGDVVLDVEATVHAVVDGFKVESVAVRENGNGLELFIGTDDEDYGGTLRPLPPLAVP